MTQVIDMNSIEDVWEKVLVSLPEKSKMEIFKKLADMMHISWQLPNFKKDTVADSVMTEAVVNPRRDDELDRFFANCSEDWGGDGDARDIADSLRNSFY